MWEKKCEELLRKHGETSVVISGINYTCGYSTYSIELCDTNGAWNVECDYDDNERADVLLWGRRPARA